MCVRWLLKIYSMAFLGKGEGGIKHHIQVNFGSMKRFKTLYFVKCCQLLRRCFFCAWFWKQSHLDQFAFHAWLVYVWLFHTFSIEYPDMVKCDLVLQFSLAQNCKFMAATPLHNLSPSSLKSLRSQQARIKFTQVSPPSEIQLGRNFARTRSLSRPGLGIAGF